MSKLPTKPTSGSWVKDAQALLEMGAKMIDSGTVRGLLDKISSLKLQIKSLKEERESLHEALAFYADARNYHTDSQYDHPSVYQSEIASDEGHCARRELSKKWD